MIDSITVNHHIQKYILDILMHRQFARFRDMRPQSTDTNLYSYHLKNLQKQHLVKKTSDGYTLDAKGLAYVDRLNAKTKRISAQPKVITMVIIQDGYGNILMYKKLRQPFIDTWTVPFGKVHDSDESIAHAAQREVHEKVGSFEVELRHAGDCYIRVKSDDVVVVSTLVHVFYGQSELPGVPHNFEWISPRELISKATSPAIKDIVARTFFQDPYFFEEFEVRTSL